MKDKVIIITGGSSGMGKYMAKRFVSEGANVVITGRKAEALEEAKKEIGDVLTIAMDVRKPELVEEMVKRTHEQFGRIDALINNAAGNFICPAEKLSINGWNSVIDIVLNGTFYCSREVGNYWIKTGQKGSIINMVATYAWNAGVGVIHSACAKAGVLTMTRTLAVEWGKKYGFRVNAIAPGPIERTGGADKLVQSDEMAKRIKESVPLGRFGTPEEIAAVASFLLSEDAAYINGACITVDGGQWLNQHPF
ncbi:NAD(P)-dependent dehydrogenase (short-subunit alcohol dehydrogenase family) [Thermolongibacillus altinsuensis]|jgi:NAD(P)-dependent dehydrogenase (short-subunit alcohol dehydrogenase family)|uniref:NAD(P)-dependent dehydrogenase (Short-subunit alcohol dehydrogenase family) n=1 Tax=Thermolongibacillus altinsuensis TaxID=575256 RepID=A0A4R1QEK1_9BACL|nr:2,4-dienoyl-CoA reductase [Thermolongibacillus altinsuensis]TCL49190.1 NAD(P)-dependent dehydrogenase (short-subunit alcohol dehydrogenase family) [Thermolongibacillus altinsuensis]GMB08637.1 2,4-dienoyl-CoA reductase [Thermolongibacillus altinsuensis]